MRYANLVERRLQEIGYRKIYEELTTLLPENDKGECRFFCPLHKTTNPHASVNLKTGKWKCFSEDCGQGGDIISYYGIVKEIENRTEAARLLAIHLGQLSEITDQTVEELHNLLLSSDKITELACKTFGVSKETLIKFKIGINRKDRRYTIPIMGQSGFWENIIKYNPNLEPKVYSWKPGHGDSRIFPLDVVMQNDFVILFEGEKDTMRAHEIGITYAATFNNGAGKYPEDLSIFKGKTVCICYDIDPPGVEGAKKVANALLPFCNKVSILTLPGNGLPENGDFSDWLNLGHTKAEFIELLGSAVIINSKVITQQRNEGVPVLNVIPRLMTSDDAITNINEADDDSEAIDILFGEIHKPHLHGKKVRFLAHCVGSSAGLATYRVPTQIVGNCNRNARNLCPNCWINNNVDATSMPVMRNVLHSQESNLNLFRTSTSTRELAIKTMFGVPSRCFSFQFSEIDRKTVQTLILSNPVIIAQMRQDEVDENNKKSIASFQVGYFNGEPIKDNKTYYFTGYIQADPKSQATVLNLIEAIPSVSAIDNYEITEKTFEAINYFKCKPDDSIRDHFTKLYNVIEAMTGIYGREDIQDAVFNTVFSVLRFNIGQKRIDTGWVETAIVGDTRTAKSTLVIRMLEIFNVGEVISCENASVAGIIGGIEYIENTPIPRWGKWPQNHAGLIVMDEFPEIAKPSKDILGQMSSMRSSGWAEITKINGSKTPACVRAIWIGNPFRGKLISTFPFGIAAIPTVIRNIEDAARFTKGYIVSVDSVSMSIMLQDKPLIQSQEINNKFHELVILTWSLTREQVLFTEESNKLLRREVQRLSEKYSSSIPLWERGSGLDKLARLCIPIAVLCGSFESFELETKDELGNTDTQQSLRVRVEKKHAEFAIAKLEEVYDNEYMKYDTYSKHEFDKERIVDEVTVVKLLLGYKGSSGVQQILQYFAATDTLTLRSFGELIGNESDARFIWSALLMNNCIISAKGGEGYSIKTSSFVKLINQMIIDLNERAKELGVELDNKTTDPLAHIVPSKRGGMSESGEFNVLVG